jgi:hypothetical protein
MLCICYIILCFHKNIGSHPGTCPAVESYDKVCSDFLDQCSEDSECSSTQKCCEDGSAYFCVDPVTEGLLIF